MTDQEKMEFLMTQQENMALKHRLISMDIETLKAEMEKDKVKQELQAKAQAEAEAEADAAKPKLEAVNE